MRSLSDLSSNHTLELTTFRTSVRSHCSCFSSLTGVQWLLYQQDNGYFSMLFDVHAGVTSFKDA